MQWADSPYSSVAERAQCGAAASLLMELGEYWGVDPARGIAVNEIWDDMTSKDSVAKLWPQTERVKAWCAMLDRATSVQEAARAGRYIEAAVRGMLGFLRPEAPGTWHEVCSCDGSFLAGPSKASSFYHVVGAIDVLGKTVGSRGAGVVSNGVAK
jgi:mannose/cellobiose epimerase-like protein (N-acyl-D-glucosamine 2-epimerase family)